MKKINKLPLLLMLLAIMGLAAFQVVWLQNSFREEKQALTVNTNILFRETARQCEAARFKMDSNIQVRTGSRGDLAGTFTAIARRMRDSANTKPQAKGAVVLAIKTEELNSQNGAVTQNSDNTIAILEKDSLPPANTITIKEHFADPREGEGAVIRILKSLESQNDTVTIKELREKYQAALAKQKINVPFTITRTALEKSRDMFRFKAEASNEVTMGFAHPISFRLILNDTATYLLKKLLPQLLVSLILLGVTVLSFWILYRNLAEQRRLNQLKNDFIGNITHELKTPIATVSVALEAMRNFDVLKDQEKTKGYLDISSSELQRLNLLVDKVLKLSMFENSEIRLQKTEFDIRKLVEEVAESMKLQLEHQGAKLFITTSGDRFTLEADRLHLSSVVYNLVDNALKYGGSKPSIEIELISHANFLEMSVSDKGIGIAAAYRQKIFDKFFRVPTGNVHNIKGYGLGLSYVNYILLRHHGSIEVESELGKGSTFIVKLPYEESKAAVYYGSR
jgi:two-component system, OmpR family, phosphate regulon sensor histidine kinase PhoR